MLGTPRILNPSTRLVTHCVQLNHRLLHIWLIFHFLLQKSPTQMISTLKLICAQFEPQALLAITSELLSLPQLHVWVFSSPNNHYQAPSLPNCSCSRGYAFKNEPQVYWGSKSAIQYPCPHYDDPSAWKGSLSIQLTLCSLLNKLASKGEINE